MHFSGELITKIRPARVRLGQLWMDAVTFDEALDRIELLVASGKGGAVFTPNVDHFVQAEKSEALREAYAGASLSLADGQPVVWAASLLGTPVPQKISGADLIPPLLERAARKGLRVYLLGGLPGVAEEAASLLRGQGVQIVGLSSPRIGLVPLPDELNQVNAIAACAPELVLVALGAPKQELWIHRNLSKLRPAVCLGVGATLDFMTGRIPRAPRWMSKYGLEWLYRLTQDPRRLARRYLVNDPLFIAIFYRAWRMPRKERIQLGTLP